MDSTIFASQGWRSMTFLKRETHCQLNDNVQVCFVNNKLNLNVYCNRIVVIVVHCKVVIAFIYTNNSMMITSSINRIVVSGNNEKTIEIMAENIKINYWYFIVLIIIINIYANKSLKFFKGLHYFDDYPITEKSINRYDTKDDGKIC